MGRVVGRALAGVSEGGLMVTREDREYLIGMDGRMGLGIRNTDFSKSQVY